MTHNTNINIGGDVRTHEDKIHARSRRLMIERGVIKPGNFKPDEIKIARAVRSILGYFFTWEERPPMSAALVQDYRNKLISEGILKPRTR